MKKIILFGNAQFAEMNHFYLTHDSPHEVAAFTADGDHIRESKMFGLPVVAFEEVAKEFPPEQYAMAIPLGIRQINQLRAAKCETARKMGYEFIRYVSSKALVWPGVEIGLNCFIYEQVVVKPFSKIGDDVLIEMGSLVGHHVHIHDHCFLAPHSVVLGGATIEPYCVIGANSTVREAVKIGRSCVIGAGAVIPRSTRAGSVYLAPTAELLPGSSTDLGAVL